MKFLNRQLPPWRGIDAFLSFSRLGALRILDVHFRFRFFRVTHCGTMLFLPLLLIRQLNFQRNYFLFPTPLFFCLTNRFTMVAHSDPYSAVGLASNPRPKIGVTAVGRPAYDSRTPTALSHANTISWITADEGSYDHHIPPPKGMSMGMNHAHSQLQLVLGDFETPFSSLFSL